MSGESPNDDETINFSNKSRDSKPRDSQGTRSTEMSETRSLQDANRRPTDSGPDATEDLPRQLGRYRLEKLLGRGGMGSVYRGVEDEAGRQVAVKLLSPSITPDEASIRRFQKEARLLAKVRHPYIANLLDVGEHDGTCFLVLEFVDGVDLRRVLSRHAPLSERLALLILRDVAQALAAAHQQGIVHRDIKPSNVLMTAAADDAAGRDEAVASAVRSGCKPEVKLTDFGLARNVEQSASLDLTLTGQILGTPVYMAPEQFADAGTVGPGTDVYALGVMLFEMLAGQRPFQAEDPVKLISLHSFSQPPDLRKLNPDVSDGALQLVQKMLQKSPAERHADADHLLDEVDRLLRGEANDVSVHPRTPPAGSALFTASWEWDLAARPEQIWPFASNTERVNCAVGVPSVEYTTDRDEFGAVRKFGTFRLGWATLKWEEHPFEWIEGRRLGVLREFQRGPFDWFLSIVELAPASGGGTHLKHSVAIAPRGLMGRLLAFMEVKVKGSKALDRVYGRIDAVASGRLRSSPAIDHFEPPAKLGKAARRSLDDRCEKLQRTASDVDCQQQLTTFIAESPAQELARIRPHALARRVGVRPGAMTEACLRACQVGLLEMHWDILCPTCRISSSVADTLAEIGKHSYCEACDLDFDVDIANAVELIFRVHPEVRQANLGTYCIGGPEHAPHVVAQVRLSVNERLELDVLLDGGVYVLRGPQLPYTVRLVVRADCGAARAHLELSKFQVFDEVPQLKAGRLLISVENKYDRPLLLRIERTVPPSDVVTAAAASQLPLFRELFPGEVLSREDLSGVSTSTLLAVRIVNSARLFDSLGDTAALRTMRDTLQQVEDAIGAAGGELVRQQDDRLLSAFRNAGTATRLAIQLAAEAAAVAEGDEHPELRIALHRGTTLTKTVAGRLSYAGRTVSTLGELIECDSSKALILTDELVEDADVQTLLAESGLAAQRLGAFAVPGVDIYEVPPASTNPPTSQD